MRKKIIKELKIKNPQLTLIEIENVLDIFTKKSSKIKLRWVTKAFSHYQLFLPKIHSFEKMEMAIQAIFDGSYSPNV